MKVKRYNAEMKADEMVEVSDEEAKAVFLERFRFFGFPGKVCEALCIDLDDYDRWMVEDAEFKARYEKAYRLFKDDKAWKFEDRANKLAKVGGFEKTAEFMASIAALQRHCPEYNNKSVLTVNTTGKGAETLLERIQKDLRVKRSPKAKEEAKEEEPASDTD